MRDPKRNNADLMSSRSEGGAHAGAARARRVPRPSASGRIPIALVALGAWLMPGTALAADTLVLIPDLTVLTVMLVGFVVLIFPLNALLFRPIFRALDARAERIAGARDRSESLQRDADDVLERCEIAIREARSDAEAARQSQLESARADQVERTANARAEAERILDNARGELEASLGEARAQLRQQAEDLARSAAERVLGRTLS